MKQLNLPAVGVGLWLLIPCASAQIPDSTNIADRVGQIILPNGIPFGSSPGPTLGIRPPRPERPDLPSEIKLKVLRFEKLREAYLARQQQLQRKLQGASDQDRVQIRTQLQSLRDEWLERARAFREEARARIKELGPELSSTRREALEAAKEGALDPTHARPRH